MSDYVDVPIKLANDENGATATIDVTGNPDYEVVSIPLPNGKKGAKAVSVVNGGGGGVGTEVDPIWVADKPNYYTKSELDDDLAKVDFLDTNYRFSQSFDESIIIENPWNGSVETNDFKVNTEKIQEKLVAGDNITIVNNVISVTGGSVGVETDPVWLGDKPNYATKQLVQDLSPASLVTSTRISAISIAPTNNLFSLATVDSRINKNGDIYNPPVNVSSSSVVPNFRHVMRRHTYNVGTIASNNAVGVNVLGFTPTIVEPDNLLPETYVGGATPNNDRLWTIPATSGMVNWVLELNIRGNIGSTNDADDLLRIELWNGTTVTKVRSILRSQLNDAVNPSGGIDIPFYTKGANDPMCIPTGGFKVLIFNRTGADITNLVVDMRIKR